MQREEPIKATSESRRAILDRLDSWNVPSKPLPALEQDRLTHFDDPLKRFSEMLTLVGGESHQVDDPGQVAEILSRLGMNADAHRIASVVPEAVNGNVELESIDDPHALESLDWMIARGAFIVAENGAIWVGGASLPHRVLLFIAQYLAIVVSRRECVHHMHEAYQRIDPSNDRYGIFVAGPSKTADIEQSLVLGAHGCRKLQVFLTP